MHTTRTVSNSCTLRGGLRLGVLAGCIGALSACAGSHEAERAYATPGDEPEPAEQANREQQMRTSEELVDPRTPGATNGPPTDMRLVVPAPATSAPELNAAAARNAGDVESEADVRDRDMREVVEGPSTARGRAQDNSAQNERDRPNKNLTPVDQSSDARDVELIANIRRSLVDDEELSFTAKNVKIVSEAGNVTLRGPVESTAEKLRVEGLARRAGASRVISLIEVEK